MPVHRPCIARVLYEAASENSKRMSWTNGSRLVTLLNMTNKKS